MLLNRSQMLKMFPMEFVMKHEYPLTTALTIS